MNTSSLIIILGIAFVSIILICGVLLVIYMLKNDKNEKKSYIKSAPFSHLSTEDIRDMRRRLYIENMYKERPKYRQRDDELRREILKRGESEFVIYTL